MLKYSSNLEEKCKTYFNSTTPGFSQTEMKTKVIKDFGIWGLKAWKIS